MANQGRAALSPMLLHHVRHTGALHQTVVLLTVVPDRRPRVPFQERHTMERLGHGFFHITVRLGFMQRPNIPLTLHNCEMLGLQADLANVHFPIPRKRLAEFRRPRDGEPPRT